MKLIDKDAVVAEIDRQQRKLCLLGQSNEVELRKSAAIQNGVYCGILSFLDTIEVKEINNIWHEASETPKGAGDKEILVQFSDFHTSVLEIDDWEYLDHQTKWAYLKDLL